MRVERRRNNMVLLGALGGVLLLAADALAQQVEWAGTAMIEHIDPKAERGGTLRVVRFSSDFSETTADQGTIIGWGNAAATGTVTPRDEPGETESIEILRRGQAASAAARD